MKLPLLHTLWEGSLSRQFLRYLVVGATAWVIDFAVFIGFYPVIGIVAAQTAARVTGALVAFAGHKVFVFNDMKSSQGMIRRQAFQYLLLWLLSYAISVACILLLVDILALHPVASKLITEAIVICINFVTMRRFIFAS